MKYAILAVIALSVFFILCAVPASKENEKLCEKHHSHDECFYAMNR